MLLKKIALATLCIAPFLSCSSDADDKTIEKNVADIIAANASYAKVAGTAENGVVSLSGTCDGQDCASNIEKQVSEVEGVKSVANQVTESPTDLTLRTSIQTIIAKYAGVQADVAAGEIVLRGIISKDLLEPLMTELKALAPKKIDNQLAIKQ